jgi:hypothetical protein
MAYALKRETCASRLTASAGRISACDALYSVVRLLPVTRFRVRECFLTVFSRFINSHLHLGSANLSACLIGNQEVG